MPIVFHKTSLFPGTTTVLCSLSRAPVSVVRNRETPLPWWPLPRIARRLIMSRRTGHDRAFWTLGRRSAPKSRGARCSFHGDPRTTLPGRSSRPLGSCSRGGPVRRPGGAVQGGTGPGGGPAAVPGPVMGPGCRLGRCNAGVTAGHVGGGGHGTCVQIPSCPMSISIMAH